MKHTFFYTQIIKKKHKSFAREMISWTAKKKGFANFIFWN